MVLGFVWGISPFKFLRIYPCHLLITAFWERILFIYFTTNPHWVPCFATDAINSSSSYWLHFKFGCINYDCVIIINLYESIRDILINYLKRPIIWWLKIGSEIYKKKGKSLGRAIIRSIVLPTPKKTLMFICLAFQNKKKHSILPSYEVLLVFLMILSTLRSS